MSCSTAPDALARDTARCSSTAAHQIEYSRDAPALVVNLAVDAARVLGQPRAAGLVNAVLRRFVRASSKRSSRGRMPMRQRVPRIPHGWYAALVRAWPEHYERMLRANNEHPPMALRLNSRRRSPAEYLGDLSAAGLSGQLVELDRRARRLGRGGARAPGCGRRPARLPRRVGVRAGHRRPARPDAARPAAGNAGAGCLRRPGQQDEPSARARWRARSI